MMSIWQFTFDLIPAACAFKYDAPLIRLSRDEMNDISLAIPKVNLDIIVNKFQTILPACKSWSRDLLIFGDEDHTNMKIWLDEESIDSITFQLSAYENAQDALIYAICHTAENLNCVFVKRDGTIFQPIIFTLGRMMLQSRAARFVRDPEGFLKALGTSVEEPSVI
ncbi:MAG: hypothetical protein J7517_03660 [Sphingobium yanoikuyae]|uniref:hypothetical protein n=1 Tax=Sphingobium yanoikuyae TaxID=13690 RepID=UPI001B297964|nr:hypothetical protein [Sphingobium yanoikuyae]